MFYPLKINLFNTDTTGADWDHNSGRDSNINPGQTPHSVHSQQIAYCQRFVEKGYYFCLQFMALTNVLLLDLKKKIHKKKPMSSVSEVSSLHFCTPFNILGPI